MKQKYFIFFLLIFYLFFQLSSLDYGFKINDLNYYKTNNFDIKDKAGAYAIQDGENSPVQKINGCTLNVIGLPICNLIELLLLFKIIKFSKKIKNSDLCKIINIWQEREGSNP